jgi:hypothetical protein
MPYRSGLKAIQDPQGKSKGKAKGIDCRHLSSENAVWFALSIRKRSTTANFLGYSPAPLSAAVKS